MSYAVHESGGKLVVTYGSSRERVIVSKLVLDHVREARASLDTAAPDFKDQLISEVKRRIEQNVQPIESASNRARRSAELLFQLAAYARVIEKVHPSELTHITLSFEPDVAKAFRAISIEVGKEKAKLTGVR